MRAVVGLVLLLFAAFPALAEEAGEPLALPRLTARVTDLTATLPAEAKAALEAKLAALEADKGSQIAVLILPSTKPEAIESFGIRLAEAWKIGRKGVDDGVIVIVAKDDRKMRIEVGSGLEGAIPDAYAKRIIADIMAPRFKQGDFAGGLDAAVDALAGLVRGEKLPEPAGRTDNSGTIDDMPPPLMVALIAIALIGNVARRFLGRLPVSLVAAPLIGGTAWYGLGNSVAAFMLMLFGLFLIHANASDLASGAIGRGGRSKGGGWSGGGGGFGGGGASGGW